MLRFRWITFDRFKVVNLSRFYRVNFIRPYWVNFTVFSKKVMTNLPEIEKPAFYQLLYYPVRASEQLNKMILDGQRNRWYARQGVPPPTAAR